MSLSQRLLQPGPPLICTPPASSSFFTSRSSRSRKQPVHGTHQSIISNTLRNLPHCFHPHQLSLQKMVKVPHRNYEASSSVWRTLGSPKTPYHVPPLLHPPSASPALLPQTSSAPLWAQTPVSSSQSSPPNPHGTSLTHKLTTKMEGDRFDSYQFPALMRRRHQPISCTLCFQVWRLLFPAEGDSSLNDKVKKLKTANLEHPLPGTFEWLSLLQSVDRSPLFQLRCDLSAPKYY